jgi:hypothetical protein
MLFTSFAPHKPSVLWELYRKIGKNATNGEILYFIFAAAYTPNWHGIYKGFFPKKHDTTGFRRW